MDEEEEEEEAGVKGVGLEIFSCINALFLAWTGRGLVVDEDEDGTVGWEGSEVVIFDRGLCLFDGRVEEE